MWNNVDDLRKNTSRNAKIVRTDIMTVNPSKIVAICRENKKEICNNFIKSEVKSFYTLAF